MSRINKNSRKFRRTIESYEDFAVGVVVDLTCTATDAVDQGMFYIRNGETQKADLCLFIAGEIIEDALSAVAYLKQEDRAQFIDRCELLKASIYGMRKEFLNSKLS